MFTVNISSETETFEVVSKTRLRRDVATLKTGLKTVLRPRHLGLAHIRVFKC